MVNIETIKLTQVKVNAENPRTISGDKFQKLVNSILVFPKMLEIRPVVVDSTNIALGGNMRTNALNFIAKMDSASIRQRLEQQKDYAKMTSGEKKALEAYWDKWLKAPSVQIIKADTLTKEEQQQFIVKDNVQFGNWDYDMLANKFDTAKLGDWGMDIWQPQESFDFNPTAGGATPTQPMPNAPADSEDDGIGVPQDLDEILDNIKADSFQGLVRGESELFSATFNFDKQYFDLIKNYIDGATKPVIVAELIRLAQEYAAEHPIATEEA